MPATDPALESPLLDRLASGPPLVAAELRPPRSGLPQPESISTWIDLHHAIRRLTRQEETVVFLTDNAVGEQEEENLRHLTTNLAGRADVSRMVPFLTCKHSLDYCLRYAQRAASVGVPALTVLGGDREVGPPRCVEHAYQLRREIRERVPSLTLGGWANPHRDPAEQVSYLASGDFTAEYFLTQVVSHHELGKVEAFLEQLERQGVDAPGIFGVFYYRSANPETFGKLSRFFPVPEREITREFGEGATPPEICRRSIRGLRKLGVRHVYVSNLGVQRAADRRQEVVEALES